MPEVLVIQRIISLAHATKICKVLNQKKHRSAPLRIELEELDFDLIQISKWTYSKAAVFASIEINRLIEKGLVYSTYDHISYKNEPAYHLKVFRDIQPKASEVE